VSSAFESYFQSAIRFSRDINDASRCSTYRTVAKNSSTRTVEDSAETITQKRATTMAGEEDDQTMPHVDEGEESDESETGNVDCEALANEVVKKKQDGKLLRHQP
jgi:hypothetical protein